MVLPTEAGTGNCSTPCGVEQIFLAGRCSYDVSSCTTPVIGAGHWGFFCTAVALRCMLWDLSGQHGTAMASRHCASEAVMQKYLVHKAASPPCIHIYTHVCWRMRFMYFVAMQDSACVTGIAVRALHL